MKLPLFIAGLWLGMLGACGGPATDQGGTGDRNFRTTPPSRLYFKNIRSSYYTMEEQPGTRVELYRLRRFAETQQRPLLVPLIADNWLRDEAYIVLRPNAYERGFSDTLRVFWQASDSSGSYELSHPDFPQQYVFARQLAGSMRSGHGLRVLTADKDTVPIFKEYDDQAHFLTTLRDFDRLTE